MFVKNRSNILKPHFYIIRNSKRSKSAHTLHSNPKHNTNAFLLPFSFFLCSMHFNSLTGCPAIRTVKCCKTLSRIKNKRTVVWPPCPLDLCAIHSLWYMTSHKSYADWMQSASKIQLWAPNIHAKQQNSARNFNILTYSASIRFVKVLRKNLCDVYDWKMCWNSRWEEFYGKARTSLFFRS